MIVWTTFYAYVKSLQVKKKGEQDERQGPIFSLLPSKAKRLVMRLVPRSLSSKDLFASSSAKAASSGKEDRDPSPKLGLPPNAVPQQPKQRSRGRSHRRCRQPHRPMRPPASPLLPPRRELRRAKLRSGASTRSARSAWITST